MSALTIFLYIFGSIIGLVIIASFALWLNFKFAYDDELDA